MGGARGVLSPSATDKSIVRVRRLVAISAGVVFDTVFNRLKKRVEEQPIGAPGHK